MSIKGISYKFVCSACGIDSQELDIIVSKNHHVKSIRLLKIKDKEIGLTTCDDGIKRMAYDWKYYKRSM